MCLSVVPVNYIMDSRRNPIHRMSSHADRTFRGISPAEAQNAPLNCSTRKVLSLTFVAATGIYRLHH